MALNKKRIERLISLRKEIESLEGAVFFTGEDESAIDDYYQQQLEEYNKERRAAKKEMTEQMIYAIENPHGGAIVTLEQLEEIAWENGFDIEEIENVINSFY